MASARAALWAAAVGASCVAVLAGCAAVPVSGVAQRMTGGGGQAQQFVEPLPPPGPEVGESGADVVSGFLHASASFAEDPAAARAYLAPHVKWNPTGTVTVVSSNISVGPTTRVPPSVSGEPGMQAFVVNGQRIATISPSGQYSYQPDSSTEFTFTVAKFRGRYKITQLPAQTSLLLTESDFQEVFQPNNLYFYAARGAGPGGPGALIPDPVYVPVQGANSLLGSVADSLVRALIHDRPSWLAGPTATEFPAGTTLASPVRISNQVAYVTLGGKAATVNLGRLQLMYAQLAATLTNSAYSPPVAQSVVLEVDGNNGGKIRSVSAVPAGAAVPSAGSAQTGTAGGPLYLAAGDEVRQQLQSGHRKVSGLFSAAQLGNPAAITAMAVSPPVTAAPRLVGVAIPQGEGCVVHEASQPQNPAPTPTPSSSPSSSSSTSQPGYQTYTMSASGGACTSLGWDNNLDLWAVTKAGITVLQAGNTQPLPVGAPALPPGSRILAMRMAPDAVRAALLVQTVQRIGGHPRLLNQLYVSAVKFGDQGVSFGPAVPVGTDLSAQRRSVSAMTWQNPYFLLAVSGSQVYQVPLTGGPLVNGQSTPVATSALPAGVQSLAASGSEMAVGTASGTVYTAISPYASWTPVPGKTALPVFPG